MDGSRIRVFLMESEIGHVSRELANKLFKNLTANLVTKREQVTDAAGQPVVVEGVREAWVMGEKGKMEKEMVSTLHEVWREIVIGIKLSPFVAGSIKKRRSDMLAERQAVPDPFDVDSTELPFTQINRPIDLDQKDLTGLAMNEIIQKIGGVVLNALVESVESVQKRAADSTWMQAAVDDLVKTGEFKVIHDAAVAMKGVNLDEEYASLTAREQHFLYDTLISREAGWQDIRTEEEKAIDREKEERYQNDLKALKGKYASGFYHGNSEPVSLKNGFYAGEGAPVPMTDAGEEEPDFPVSDLPDLN